MVKLGALFLVVAFDTATAAIEAEKKFQASGLCGRLIPCRPRFPPTAVWLGGISPLKKTR